MRVLFIGDIVGSSGRKMLQKHLAALKQSEKIDFCVANIENLAGGNGITSETYQAVCQSGVDLCTGGNHSFDKKEGISLYDSEDSCLRPANYPPELEGKGHATVANRKGQKLGVVNLMGRTFMDPLDCPFKAAEKLVTELKKECKCILVDIHAEATSEKMAMGWFLDGEVSFVVGTHTHVQTADERILEQGTAFLTDAGMTGPYDSVIGVKKEIVVEKFVRRRGRKFEVAKNDPWLCGAIVQINSDTGLAQSIKRVKIVESDPSTHPKGE